MGKKCKCNHLKIIDHRCFVSNCFTDDKEEILKKIEYAGSVAVCKASPSIHNMCFSNECKKNKNKYVVDKNCWNQSERDAYGNIIDEDLENGPFLYFDCFIENNSDNTILLKQQKCELIFNSQTGIKKGSLKKGYLFLLLVI